MTYEEIYRSKLMSAEDAVESQVKSGDKIAIGGLALADKVLKAVISDVKAGRLEDISLFGNLITSDIGLDDEDIPKDKFRYYAFFNGGYERAGAANGIVTNVPLHLSRFEDYFTFVDPDVAIVPMTPPDEHGYCNIGPAGYSPSQINHSKKIIAQINIM